MILFVVLDVWPHSIEKTFMHFALFDVVFDDKLFAYGWRYDQVEHCLIVYTLPMSSRGVCVIRTKA